MDCCLLSAEEVGRLTHYNILPNHSEHIHIPCAEAIQGLKDETLKLVTGRNGRNYVTQANMYFIRAMPSGPARIRCIQRVVENQLLYIKPLR